MLGTKTIRIGNTLVSAGLDGKNKQIHILDLDKGMSLTNALDPNFCQKVLDQLTTPSWSAADKYEFICYHTDGMISKFILSTENFEFLSPTDERVDEEMRKEMFYLYGAF